MRILTIANHKGGTGKTATTRALGKVLTLKYFYAQVYNNSELGYLGFD